MEGERERESLLSPLRMLGESENASNQEEALAFTKPATSLTLLYCITVTIHGHLRHLSQSRSLAGAEALRSFVTTSSEQHA